MRFQAVVDSVATEFVDSGVLGLSVVAEVGLSTGELLER